MLTKKQVAQLLNVSIATVNRYMAKGMPYHKIGVKLVRFHEKEVLQWLNMEEGA